MKNTLIIAGGLLIALVLAGCTGPDLSSTTSTTGDSRAVFTVADAAANMGAVSSVKVQVDKVRVHSTTQGWVTVSSQPHTYDLLALKSSGKQEVLADAKLQNGTYDKMWLDISHVTVTDDNGTHDAKLPSGTLKMQGAFAAHANKTATTTFDFQTDKSLHVTGNGKYIMAPVVHVQTREDAEVSIGTDKAVHITGGNVHTDVEVGMDENGTVGIGVHIPENEDLNIAAGTIVRGSTHEQNGDNTETSESANGSATVTAGNNSATASGSIGGSLN